MTRRTETQTDRQLEQSTGTATVNADDVARRAYELYEARGAEPGRDLDDWLRAEHELQAPAEPTRNEPV